MTYEITKANTIIQHHIAMSMAAGALPFAGIDMIAVATIQHGMLKELCALFNQSFDKEGSKAMICTISGTAVARLGASFIKTIPVVGTAIGIFSMSIMSGASTYALGQMFTKYLNDEVLIKDINTKEARRAFRRFYMQFLKNYKKKTNAEHTVDALSGIADLRDQENITKEAFEKC